MSFENEETLNSQPDGPIEDEIRELEQKLARARIRLKARDNGTNSKAHEPHMSNAEHPRYDTYTAPSITKAAPALHATTHFLLLLSDSALPLGSFAFSSGLESYLAHNRHRSRVHHQTPGSHHPHPHPSGHPPFDLFLPASVSSYAATTLPFVLAAHRDPARLAELDDDLDAATICTVGKRASAAQGRALLGIWERSFAASLHYPANGDEGAAAAAASLGEYSRALRAPAGPRGSEGGGGDGTGLPPVSAHLAPLFGAVCRVAGLSTQQAAYVFMLGHVKALVSAAVRANLFGPYQAQRVLAGGGVQGMIAAAVAREWDTPVEEAGQSVPVVDLWVGRHELLYSRIFNS